MYNRYIPQPDGSYRKNRIDEPRPPRSNPSMHPQQPPHRDPPPPPPPDYDEPPCLPPQEEPPCPPPSNEPTCPPSHHANAESFLRRLLPSNLDTGDLLVILLLLLMAGDKKENSASALLTLALYLIL